MTYPLEGGGALDLTPEQFSRIQSARLTCSIISLTVNFIAIVVFIYLVIYHRARVNRPSLRCAAFCCLATFIENFLNVIMVAVQGESKLCLAMAYLVQYFIILGVTLLALIGINLVLVYVVNFRKRHRLEYIYYPFAIIYSGVGLVGPIINYYDGNRKQLVSENPNDSCWYVNFMQNRYGQSLSFMWLYGFVFFSAIIALLSSIIAIIKVVNDSHILSNLFKSRQKASPSNKSQVIIRCLLYPLVPLLSNFLGFLLQCMITISRHSPGYGLTLASGVLQGLGGVLVALIFLNDPAISHIFLGWYDHWYYKHVVEYVTVETASSNYIKLLDCNGNFSENTSPGEDGTIVLVSFPQTKSHMYSFLFRWCDGRLQSRHPLYRARDSHNDDDNKNNLVLGVDCPDMCESSDSSEVTIKYENTTSRSDNIRYNEDYKAKKKSYRVCSTEKLPMRRLKLSTSSLDLYMGSHYFTPEIILRRSFSRNITVDEPVNGYFIVVDENSEDSSYIFINYSSNLHAKFIRCLLNNCIGRAIHRASNLVIDVNISAEPIQVHHDQNPAIKSFDPTEEL